MIASGGFRQSGVAVTSLFFNIFANSNISIRVPDDPPKQTVAIRRLFCFACEYCIRDSKPERAERSGGPFWSEHALGRAQDGRLAIGAVLLETTLENIKTDSRIAVACADPLTGEAYQLKGTAELLYEGEEYDHYKKLTNDTYKGAMQFKCVMFKCNLFR